MLTIKKIVLNTSGASNTDAVCTVSVGGAEFGSSASLTKTAAEYTFEGSASGKLEIKWTQTSATAVYINSISIVVE